MPNLIGSGLSQVPTNSMLGGMAYQDAQNVTVGKLVTKGDVTIEKSNLSLSDGNIFLADGHGIQFGGTESTSMIASQTLHDYEEGRWVATCANSVTLHGVVNSCSYIKIGGWVTVYAQIRVNSSNSNSVLLINNLPFAPSTITVSSQNPENSYLSVGTVRLYNADIPTDGLYVICYAGSSGLEFEYVRDNTTSVGLPATDNGYYMFTASYYTTP